MKFVTNSDKYGRVPLKIPSGFVLVQELEHTNANKKFDSFDAI